MSTTHRVFTVTAGKVDKGAKVESIALQGVDTTITALTVGESGRGRKLGVLPSPPASVAPCPGRGEPLFYKCRTCGTSVSDEVVPDVYGRSPHPDTGTHTVGLVSAEVGTSRSGKPRLNRGRPERLDDSKVIVVFRTPMGYRGGNQHTGVAKSEGGFEPFPGEVLAEGTIAEGAAGRMGSGRQIVAIIDQDAVFRTHIFSDGRSPAEVYYGWWDGQKLTVMPAADYALWLDADSVEPLSDQDQLSGWLREWRRVIAREHRTVRNSAEMRALRDRVESVLRGGSIESLRDAWAAVEATPGANSSSAKWQFEESRKARPQATALPPQAEEPLARWEWELLTGRQGSEYPGA